MSLLHIRSARINTPYKLKAAATRYTLFVYVAILGHTHIAHANFSNPLGNITLYDFLISILEAVIIIMFPILILMIIYTGFLFVSARGNDQKLELAKRSLIWSVIGALVVLSGLAIVEVIRNTVDAVTN